MKIRVKKRFYFILLLVICIILFANSKIIGTLLYPIQYKEVIRNNAEKYDLEPQLIAAIIRAESNFQTGRESRKGALGLMQLMPETANWVMDKAGFEKVDDGHLLEDVDASVEIGSWYLHSLFQQFNNNQIAAIAAYNAGPGNVRKWLKNGTWDGLEETVKNIPFGETRHYVQKVQYYYNKYKKTYPIF
ncbi:lytic transglycosylase domain-containing protein [Paenibacillus yanchengensis]|uniref:Lytic transglycosylase domain-containing protein n=1 Tax=Paenibacillus yanchengensis TaxID=2035833 RepID=A0ABW4YQA3_9BACL